MFSRQRGQWLRRLGLGDLTKVLGRLEVLVPALSCPGRLRHRRIDLLQVELVLHSILVNVRDHVWRLDEGHGERGAHEHGERWLATLGCLREPHHDRLELLAKATLHVERLDDDCALLILLNVLEVLQVHRHVLVVLVHLAELLVHHGAHEVQLLDSRLSYVELRCALTRIVLRVQQLIADLLCSSLPVAQLHVEDDAVEVVFAHIERAETDVRQVGAVRLVRV